jgi:hypothetical protein
MSTLSSLSVLMAAMANRSGRGRVPLSDEFDEFEDQDQDTGELDFEHLIYDGWEEPNEDRWDEDTEYDDGDFDDEDLEPIDDFEVPESW